MAEKIKLDSKIGEKNVNEDERTSKVIKCVFYLLSLTSVIFYKFWLLS